MSQSVIEICSICGKKINADAIHFHQKYCSKDKLRELRDGYFEDKYRNFLIERKVIAVIKFKQWSDKRNEGIVSVNGGFR